MQRFGRRKHNSDAIFLYPSLKFPFWEHFGYNIFVHVISRKRFLEFWQKHPDSEEALRTWLRYVQSIVWKSPNEIREQFGAADFLAGNRVCFNIKGNSYRLVVKVHYNQKRVYIRFIGTHSEYDKIDANTV